MAQQLLLTVPDHIYQQAQEVARRRQQPVETVLVDTLRGAFPEWPVHPQRAQMLQEEAAFEAMREELLATHRGQFVAVQNGRVVDYDERELELLQRVQSRFPGQLILVREVTSAPLPPLYFRSPRFVKDT